ncbi:hypothetical protein BABINDRAFT_167599 [Babjeviella inositovora NRRL Y-12698]|uniref:RING-type domain-containing protein n=1 Tax=Babjeviella inositovora NRRL Y-12698 TaxID=984486 RepID=A0A1E3QNN1_9ASCO|nr:uncharacterized protein BABINDRAFT_167599 [Babjeviella inositovora NRRL Y-12698]ODQ79054.1 hypothetical protein BABINDRAFT_167599 [Babjeviella inositovora NRRL Y-12698]
MNIPGGVSMQWFVPPGQQTKPASEEVLENLEYVNPDELPVKERQCTICYDEFQKEAEPAAIDFSDLYNFKVPETSYFLSPGDPELLYPTEATAKYCAVIGRESKKDRLQRQQNGDEHAKHDAVRVPDCGHIFGRSCIIEWLKEHASCPLCRGEVTASTALEHRSFQFPESNALPNFAGPENLLDDPAVPFPVYRAQTSRQWWGSHLPSGFHDVQIDFADYSPGMGTPQLARENPLQAHARAVARAARAPTANGAEAPGTTATGAFTTTAANAVNLPRGEARLPVIFTSSGPNQFTVRYDFGPTPTRTPGVSSNAPSTVPGTRLHAPLTDTSAEPDTAELSSTTRESSTDRSSGGPTRSTGSTTRSPRVYHPYRPS